MEQFTKITSRHVQTIERAFLFGHYDSRGGSNLIEARNLFEAMDVYAVAFGWEVVNGRLESPDMQSYWDSGNDAPTQFKNYDEWRRESLHELLQDLQFSCTCIVCDMPFETGARGELDATYEEPPWGYSYGTLEMRVQDEHGKWGPWENVSTKEHTTLVFWKGPMPKIGLEAMGWGDPSRKDLQLRIKPQSYGEDANGMGWFPKGSSMI